MGWIGGLIGLFIFTVKVMVFMLMYVWFRATFPRFRFDQLMDLGWKWLIPLALANIVVTGILVLAGLEWLLSVFGAVVLIATIALVVRGPKSGSAPGDSCKSSIRSLAGRTSSFCSTSLKV